MAKKITRGNAMNREEKKRYLRGYLNAKKELKRLEDEYETVKTEATRIVPMLTGMPSSNVKDDRTLKYVAKMLEISKKMEKAKTKIAIVDKEMSHLRPFHRNLISKIDLYHVPIKVIAKQLAKDEQSVKKMRNRIIDNMFVER